MELRQSGSKAEPDQNQTCNISSGICQPNSHIIGQYNLSTAIGTKSTCQLIIKTFYLPLCCRDLGDAEPNRNNVPIVIVAKCKD